MDGDSGKAAEGRDAQATELVRDLIEALTAVGAYLAAARRALAPSPANGATPPPSATTNPDRLLEIGLSQFERAAAAAGGLRDLLYDDASIRKTDGVGDAS